MFTCVFVDETVLVDYLGERRAYLACRDRLCALELAGCIRLLTTPEVCRRVRDGLAGDVPEGDLSAALDALLRYVKLRALPEGLADAGDFCLVSWRADNPGDTAGSGGAGRSAFSGAGVFTPDGFFEHLEREEGMAFELVDF